MPTKFGESLEDFLQRLKSLSNECNFADATDVQIREAAIRDVFIAGLSSSYIRQRIQENVLQLKPGLHLAYKYFYADRSA